MGACEQSEIGCCENCGACPFAANSSGITAGGGNLRRYGHRKEYAGECTGRAGSFAVGSAAPDYYHARIAGSFRF